MLELIIEALKRLGSVKVATFGNSAVLRLWGQFLKRATSTDCIDTVISYSTIGTARFC